MSKEKFTIIIKALYRNNQLFIPKGLTIDEWIDIAYSQDLGV